VHRGTGVFEQELAAATAELTDGAEIDAMTLLREPVARSTTAGVLPGLPVPARDRIGDLVLAWIDALGPVIASPSTPHRWGRMRRAERRAREDLHAALSDGGCPDVAATATLLAAGIQVPVAAGAWLLVELAEPGEVPEQLRCRPELARAVAWETVRLCPPTWVTARITTEDAALGSTRLASGSVVLVSPLLLGRLEALAPGREAGAAPLDRFDPLRWDQDRIRPGAWLPFGAGPHACPGRNLGLAQLTHLADWARGWIMAPVQQVHVDQSRGIFPRPALLRLMHADAGSSRTADRPLLDGSA
jgi:cytochrome P450